jgi:flagellar basal body-associated protein FliL
MPAPPVASSRIGDTRRVLVIVSVIAVIIAVPVGIVGGIRWLDLTDTWSGPGRPQPKWVTSGEVRATTRDGTLVKTRVAFDAGDASTKSAVQRRLREVSLLLELSIGAFSTLDLAGPKGIERLSQDMLKRVNAYLVMDGVAPMKAVALQDLWYTRP